MVPAGEPWREERAVYAIIEDSGSQIKVSKGDVVDLDLRDLEDGAKEIVFDRVLAIGGGDGPATIGKPYVAGASVTGEILGELLGDKIVNTKYKRRKGYRRKLGHRQPYLRVRIGEIKG
jgi:large subunit ribosomal protein L21